MGSLVPSVDTTTASPARIYDYMLGGKDNFAVDRDVAEKMLRAEPDAARYIRQNRRFLVRAVRHLAADAGIRRFLDIGSGLPTQDNVHQVAQRHAPGSQVVYVDNDPTVIAHARALMKASSVTVVDGDLRRPAGILDDAHVRALLEPGEPVALLLIAILHFVPDSEAPYDAVAHLVNALPPGSHVVIAHGTRELRPDVADTARDAYQAADVRMALRPPDAVARFFDGLDPLPPGLVWARDWHPDNHDLPDQAAGILAGVARKPTP